MSTPGIVDLRRFRWPLAPLQRKMEWELEAAKVRLAKLQGEAQQAASRLERLEAARAEQSAVAARLMHAQANAPAYVRGLGYLSVLATRIAEAARQRQVVHEMADQARTECLACQRRLDVLVAAREGAIDHHVREALRQQAREADAAWLALRSGEHERVLESGA